MTAVAEQQYIGPVGHALSTAKPTVLVSNSTAPSTAPQTFAVKLRITHLQRNKEKRAYDSLFSARSLPFFNHVQYDFMQNTLLRSQDSYPNELNNSETPTY
ncbi:MULTISPECIES: hypothetical protein [unclassified Pseudomonas]|uniref:hypothetical protein n=1 Tax=unclassified Pseudomonas TaxID=196821 RepID=UPI001C49BA84|nr:MULTISPECIES: hypothetical protein [unclassified Pseudomonas]